LTHQGNSPRPHFALFAGIDPAELLIAQIAGIRQNTPGNHGGFGFVVMALNGGIFPAGKQLNAIEAIANAAGVFEEPIVGGVATCLQRAGAQYMLEKSAQIDNGVRTCELAGQTFEALANKAKRHGPQYRNAWKAAFAGALQAIPHLTFEGDRDELVSAIETSARTIGLEKGSIMAEVIKHLTGKAGATAANVIAGNGTGNTSGHAEAH
jgi:hypothetical protein